VISKTPILESFDTLTTLLTNKGFVSFTIEVFSLHPAFAGFGLFLKTGLNRNFYNIHRFLRLLPIPISFSFEKSKRGFIYLFPPQSIATTRLAIGLVFSVLTALCCHMLPPLHKKDERIIVYYYTTNHSKKQIYLQKYF
jgi:hypothetical protein